MFDQELPPLSTEQAEALEASIAREGVRTPIVVDETGMVLDGHHRVLFAEKHGKEIPKLVREGLSDLEKRALVYQANFARRNLSPSQQKEVKRRMKKIALELKEKHTQAEIGALLGVARQTVQVWLNGGISNAKDGNANTPDSRVTVPKLERAVIFERANSGEKQEQLAADYGVTQGRIAQIVKQQTDRKAREEAASKIEAPQWMGDWKLPSAYVADCAAPEFLQALPRNAVDLIVTDPPWGNAAFEEGAWEALGRIAMRTLKPGQLLLTYTGKMYMPEVYHILSQHLIYRWTLGIFQPDSNDKVHGYQLYSSWRPVLMFAKPGEQRQLKWMPDSTKSTRDKQWHEWGQDWRPAKDWIEALTLPNEVVLDPFAGGGAFLYAAKEANRQWVGFDRDEEAVKKCLYRLQ